MSVTVGPTEVIVDATFGGGGHTKSLLDAVHAPPGLRIIAVDRDPLALSIASRLSNHLIQEGSSQSVVGVHGELGRLREAVRAAGEERVDAVLMDLGPSSMQLDSPDRGFSLTRDAPLDMRMDPSSSKTPTAAMVVNSLSKDELGQIFSAYSDDTYAFRIAKAIFKVRTEVGPIYTTRELAKIIETVVGFGARDSLGRKAHPATKTFQSLRMFVNDELTQVWLGMQEAAKLLAPGKGKLAVLSFHSGEDRVVKRGLQGLGPDDRRLPGAPAPASLWTPLSSRVATPTQEEILRNPRARSAKLRVALRSNNPPQSQH